MARILPSSINADFLKAYGVEGMDDCAPETLTIKVWDRYGTAPKDDADAKAEGEYVAAVVICDGCEKSVELHRERLSA